MYTLANFEAIWPISINPPPAMEEYQIPPGCKMNTESVIMELLIRGRPRPGREGDPQRSQEEDVEEVGTFWAFLYSVTFLPLGLFKFCNFLC